MGYVQRDQIGQHEASRQRSTVNRQVGPEVALDPRGDASTGGIGLSGLRQERLEVMLD